MNTRVWICSAVSLLALRCTIPQPQYGCTNRSQGGLCASSLTLDGEGGVWTGGGCELGWSGPDRIATATEAQRSRVVDAFAALPAPTSCPGDGGYPPDSTTLFHTTDEDGRSWDVCPALPDGGPAPEFVEAIDAIRALRPPR